MRGRTATGRCAFSALDGGRWHPSPTWTTFYLFLSSPTCWISTQQCRCKRPESALPSDVSALSRSSLSSTKLISMPQPPYPTRRRNERPGQSQGQNPEIQHHWSENRFALSTVCSSGATSALYIHFLVLTLNQVPEGGIFLPVSTRANSASKTKLHFPASLAIRSEHPTEAYPVK